MTTKRALVTGANGFLGRHVAKIFSDNDFTVSGIGHGKWERSEWEPWGLSYWKPCSITLEAVSSFIQKPDVIVHCAGSGSVGFSLANPMQDFEKTVSTTLTLLEYVRLSAPESAFVYPSSAAVYGSVDSLPISEVIPPAPVSPYGVHKKIAEDLICSYANHFSVKAVITRFFSLYGPGLKKQLLWDICTKAENGNIQFNGTGNEIRDWLHVRDAARLLFILSSHAQTAPLVINGGSGRATTVGEIVIEILEKMGIEDSPKFSQVLIRGDPKGYLADIRAARGYGWKPEISLEDGIDEYIRWYRSGAR